MASKKTSLEELLSVFQKEKTFLKEKEKISVYIYEGYKISVKLYYPDGYDYFQSEVFGNIILAFLNIIELLKEKQIPFSDLKNSDISIFKTSYIIYKSTKIFLETEEMYTENNNDKKEEENIKIIKEALSDLTKICSSYDEILYKLYKYVVDKNLK